MVFVLFKSGALAQQILQKTFDDVNPSCMIPAGDAGYLISGTKLVNGKVAAVLFKIDSIGNQEWAKIFSDSAYNLNVEETIRLHDGGYLTSGSSYNQTTGKSMYWITKTDNWGNFLQAKKYSSSISTFCPHIIENADSSIICAGERNYAPQSGLPPKNFMLMKLDANLNVIWAKEYAFRFQNFFTDIVLANDGNYILQGFAEDTTLFTGRSDYVVLKIDTAGDLIWAKQCGNKQPSGVYPFSGQKLKELNDGTIINAFSTYWYNTSTDIALQKLDSLGNEIISHRIANFNPQGADLLLNFYCYNNEFFLLNLSTILKTDYNLNSIFTKRVITPWPNWLSYNQLNLFNNNMGGIDLVGGATTTTGLSKILFTKADSTAEIGCGGSSQLLINQYDSLPSVDITNFIFDSAIVVVDSLILLSQNSLVLNDSDLCETATSIEIYNKDSDDDFVVFPTLTTTYLTVINKTDSIATLRLFDLTSRKLILYDSIVKEKKELNIENLKSGIYFLSIESQLKFRTFKIIKI